MEIEKLQSLSDEILAELVIVWERSVRSSHHFLKEEDKNVHKIFYKFSKLYNLKLTIGQ